MTLVSRMIRQKPPLQQRAAFVLAMQQLHAAVAGVLLHLLTGKFLGAEFAFDFALWTRGREMVFHADARNASRTILGAQNCVPFAYVQVSLWREREGVEHNGLD